MPGYHKNYIIALGGTGGKAMAAFRRATVLRHGEFEQMQRQAAFQYLYIDSNAQDIAAAGQDTSKHWQVPGGKITLTASEKVCIDGTGFTMEAAKMLDNIKPWFGNIDNISNNVFHGTAIIGAGQRRRYGRMLFARQANTIRLNLTNGLNALRSTCANVDPSTADVITFHIFATLGGGTGSGSIVDMVTLAHDMMSGNEQAEVILYLFVGGDDPNVKLADVGFLYQNEYAALRDLNALMSNRWHPVKASDPNGGEFNIINPIQAVYISSENSPRKLGLDKQVEHMANACFDMISIMVRGLDTAHARVFTGEDLYENNAGECCVPGKTVQELPRDDKPERSYRFHTVGISRCKEPVMEIRTILKSVFAAQINDRWLYGSLGKRDNRIHSAWENDSIFDGSAIIKGSSLDTRCKSYEEEKLAKFREDFNGENLEFAPDTLRDINRYVQEMIATIQTETLNDLATRHGEPSAWQKLCAAEAGDVLSNIKRKLEYRRRWAVPHSPGEPIWGVSDVTKYLLSLRDRLSKSTPSKLFSRTLGNMESRDKEWRKICGLTELLFDKNEEMVQLHLEEAEAVIIRELQARRSAISNYVEKKMVEPVETLSDVMQTVGTTLSNSISNRNQAANEQMKKIRNNMADVQLVYEEAHLLKHMEFLRSDDAEEQIASSVALFESRRSDNDALETGYPMPSLDERNKDYPNYWSESMRIHNWLVQNKQSQYHAAFHDSIYEALSDLKRLKPDEYEDKMHALCANVYPLADVSAAPLGGPGLKHLGFLPPVKAVMVGLPGSNTERTIAENSRDAVRQFIHGEMGGKASAPERYTEYEHDDKHELRIMYCQYWMPVRFFSFCSYLQQCMDAVYNKGTREAKLATQYFTHIDDMDEVKPAIIPMAINPRQYELLLMFRLACHLPIPGLSYNGQDVMVAKEKDDSTPEPRLQLLKTSAITEAVRVVKEYDSHQLVSASTDFDTHLHTNVKTWMKTYGRSHKSMFFDHISALINELNETGDESNTEKVNELDQLKDFYLEELKKI